MAYTLPQVAHSPNTPLAYSATSSAYISLYNASATTLIPGCNLAVSSIEEDKTYILQLNYSLGRPVNCSIIGPQ